MVDCTSTTAVDGSSFRMYIDSNPTGTVSWTIIGGETTSSIDIKAKTADASNKDSAGGMTIPTGYDWTMACDASWMSSDTGQELVRAAALAKTTTRIAWRPSGDTTGYYGWASFGWKADAKNQDIASFTFDVNGCGDIIDAG